MRFAAGYLRFAFTRIELNLRFTFTRHNSNYRFLRGFRSGNFRVLFWCLSPPITPSAISHHQQPTPLISFDRNNETTASINRTKAVRDQTVTILQCVNFRSKTANAAAALDGSRYQSPVAQTAAGLAMLERAGTTCLQGRSSGAWYDNTNEPTSVSFFSKALLQNITINRGGLWSAKMEVYQTTYLG